MAEKEKLTSMADAIDRHIKSGDTLYLGGFVQHDPFAAAHEIIRQGKKDLTLSSCTCLISVDQLIGAGVVKHLIASFTWNPLPTTAHCFVRALTQEIPHKIEMEEYSMLALNLAYFAGALDLPYIATKTILGSGSDWERNNSGAKNRLKFQHSPFTGERVCLVPPIKHDVGIIQVQRSDPYGNAQAWGMMGESQYGLQSCGRIIICAEEIVSTDVIMRDPNRTLVPAFRVNAVVEEPWGAHPSPLAGYYDIDWPYYAFYERETQSEEMFHNFLKKWVYGVKDRKEYVNRLGAKRLEALRPEPFSSEPVPYGKLTRLFEV
ncbi:MAG: CoA transferase subunit A [Deltaproteobacteria bacterium]|nr:MAG: CoA transferase subunit A [Deltaproteobacteria bacterium]